ncbi:MAG: peptidase M22 [Eubacteriales bacterium]|nr:peptidase M22 [Eubacteriales bacterium]
MANVLGIDTSNYTTSCALYMSDTGEVISLKKLLPVKEGERGIRQSDGVFHHVNQISPLMTELLGDKNINIHAVCASTAPRPVEGSYMPVFTVGSCVAQTVSAALNVPFFETSHQQGHIMAALFSAGRMDLISKPFIAFHVSGGTTEAILVTPSEKDIIKCEIIAETLDLNAGQLIDRIGVLMGLSFPCGKALEELALKYTGKIKVKPVLKEQNCHLSGFENKLSRMYEESSDKPMVSAYTLAYVEATISAMTERLLQKYGKLPVVFAGGVMSNSIIRDKLSKKFDSSFAKPEFSCDNAAGVAILGYFKSVG